jgi:hypothetical protein
MITYNILAGSVDVSVVIRIIDSTDGTPETGVVFNTAGIDLEYRRELAATVDITEATLAALTTAHADGGFLHIGNGYYRLDLPDAAVAAGVSGVLVHGTVTGMVVIGCYINLTPWPVDMRMILGTVVATPATAGILDVNVKNIDNDAASASGTVTFPNATLASTVNITAGTVTTATNVTTVNGLAANVVTAAAIADGAIDAATFAANAITSTVVANDFITAAKLHADVTTELQSGLATAAALATVDDFVDTEVAAVLAAVDTEVAAILALLDDARGEPGQAAPPVNPDMATKIDYLYKAWRNKKTNDGTTTKLFADDAATVDQKQATSEAAGTVTKGEWATGP